MDPPALEPLKRYPAHIEGDEVIVSSRAIEPESRVGPIDGRRVLILGSGAAGTAAAFALREAGFTGTVTMIGDEAMEPYDRTVLSKFVLNDISPSDVPWLRRDGDWKAQKIDRLEGTIVISTPGRGGSGCRTECCSIMTRRCWRPVRPRTCRISLA